MESRHSRSGSLIAGGYDEFFTPVDDCMSLPGGSEHSHDTRSGRSQTRVSETGAVERSRSRSSSLSSPRRRSSLRRSSSHRRGSKSSETRRVSLQAKTSQHGADIGRQSSKLGSALNIAAGDRVKSTVSGFLDRDYHTPNDSVPVLSVREKYSRLMVHTSDEDTDSGLDEPTQYKYGAQSKTLRNALQNVFAVRKAITGIPRMQGYMRLPDRHSAPKEPKDPKLYTGKSYLVEPPERVERSTRALTRSAILRVIEMERSRRVAEIRARGAAVSQTWLDVQNELKEKVKLAEEEQNEITIATTQTTEATMELVREQMMHEVHRRHLQHEEDEAKEFRQMFFKGVAKNKLPADTMEIVTSTNEHLSSVLEELVEAFQCRQMEDELVEEAAVEKTHDLKDACLTELMRCVVTHKITIEVKIETERQVREFKRGRPAAARKSSSSENQPDVSSAKAQVGSTIEKLFKKVETRELKKEDRQVDKVSEFKCICQEELIRKVWQRKVSVLCRHEKARRIVEADDPAAMDDDKKLAVSDAWVRVQAQMIIDKFKGLRPMKKSIAEVARRGSDGSPSPVRTGLDRALRAARERFRKPAVYICDEDDEFARERARRKCRLSASSPSERGGRRSVGTVSRSSLMSGGSRASAGRRRLSSASRSSLPPDAAAAAHSSQHRPSAAGRASAGSISPAGDATTVQSDAARIAVVKSSLDNAGQPIDRQAARREARRHSAAAVTASRPATQTQSAGRGQYPQPSRSRSQQSAMSALSRSQQSAATARSQHSAVTARSNSRHSMSTARSPSRQSTATAQSGGSPVRAVSSRRRQSAVAGGSVSRAQQSAVRGSLSPSRESVARASSTRAQTSAVRGSPSPTRQPQSSQDSPSPRRESMSPRRGSAGSSSSPNQRRGPKEQRRQESAVVRSSASLRRQSAAGNGAGHRLGSAAELRAGSRSELTAKGSSSSRRELVIKGSVSPRRGSTSQSAGKIVVARGSHSRSPLATPSGSPARSSTLHSTAAPPVAARRSRSYVSARSSTPLREDSSPPGILKKSSGHESPRRASAGVSQSQQRRRSASSQQSVAAASAPQQVRSRRSRAPGSTVSAPAGPTGRRSRSGAANGRGSGGAEPVPPRRLRSELAQPAPAGDESRQYRRRGEKTDEFRRERAAIADGREHQRHERQQRRLSGGGGRAGSQQRRRSLSSGRQTDQFRGHWTAHIE